jgi:hypothetical protein
MRLPEKVADVANVAHVYVRYDWNENTDVRVHVALSVLGNELVEGADGTLASTAGYGSHFAAVEIFGSRQVFDGQHGGSPKGWFGLVSDSLGSQDILHRPCQLSPNTKKGPKWIKSMKL